MRRRVSAWLPIADKVRRYQTYYFELIGQTNAFGLTAISSSLQVIANCVAVVLSDVIPRRKGLVGGGTL